MTETTDVKSVIIDAYLDYLTKNNKVPTYTDLLEYSVTRNKIRTHFGNLTRLHKYIADNHRSVLDASVAHAEYVFNPKKLEKIESTFADTKVFILTTVVSGKAVDENLLATIKQYLARRNGQLILLASEDIASRQTFTSYNWRVDQKVRDEYFVTKEFQLNSNLFVSDIKVSAKQIIPTTGLSRIGQTNGSYIFASPKQMLEFVANSPKSFPKAIMTTGALTVPDYTRERWMSQRTSYIAEHDHVMGGIIVEIVDDKYFHFRQFQSNADGEFVDLGVRYFPDGTAEAEDTDVYLGDLHAGHEDSTALTATLRLCFELAVNNMIVGDFFDGYSISHHHMNQPLKRAEKAMAGTDDLVSELKHGGVLANLLLDSITGDLVMVRGNHDEVLERYLNSGNYTKDLTNQYVALGLAQQMLEGLDPLVEAYRKYGEINDFERIVWLSRDDQYKIATVECGQHGDLGANGSRASLLSLEKAYGKCIVGHAHSAAIMRGVFRVGTLSQLSLEYNKGPSSWTHTSCLVYPDGSRQLINVVNGSTHLEDKYSKVD